MLIDLVAVGSLWFWSFLVLVLLIGAGCTNSRDYMPVNGLVVLAAVGVTAFTSFNVFQWAWTNPATLILWFLIYLAIGAVWTVFQWWWFVTCLSG